MGIDDFILCVLDMFNNDPVLMIVGDLFFFDEQIEDYIEGCILYHEIKGVFCMIQYLGIQGDKHTYRLMSNVIING